MPERELRGSGGKPALLNAPPEGAVRLRLPALGGVLEAAAATLRRFPLVVASAVASAVAAILAADNLGPETLQGPLLAAASLGIPLLTAVALVGEQMQARWSRTALALAALVVLVGVHASWNGWSEPVRFARYAQLCVAFHLLVAFLPFARGDRPTAFWQYNRILFVRFLIAGVTSATLFLGLALALAALDKLFAVDVPHQAYVRVWVLCAFVFNTWFFLGGLPRDLDGLEASHEYPAVLRIFTQYTLVPLVTVYLVMLTLYFGKVVVSWDWPSGWMGYLVSGVAGAGIFALLLVYPLAELPEQRWIAVFARDFWLGVLPAVVMLWLAIYQRVHQYGFTEPRYFLLALSVWLAAIAVYYVVSRARRIRIIPASLCVVSLLTFAGPWGAFTVSRRSQLARVRNVLEARGVLADGKIRRATTELPAADRSAVSGAVRYLVETHGSLALKPLLGDSFATRVLSRAEWSHADAEQRARAIVQALGITYVSRWENPLAGGPQYSFSAGEGDAVPVSGYDLLVPIRAGEEPVPAGAGEVTAVLVRAVRSIRISRGGEVLLDVPLDSLVARARASARGGLTLTLPPAELRAEAANARARAVVLLRSIQGRIRAGKPDVRNAAGMVLLKLSARR